MPAWGVQILLDEVSPRLRGISERMRPKVADAMYSVGGQMEAMARDIVPVRTGFLRDSIFHDILESDLNMLFGAKADYAAFVEFGTRRMRSQPFIRPALDAYSQALLDAILVGCLNAF